MVASGFFSLISLRSKLHPHDQLGPPFGRRQLGGQEQHLARFRSVSGRCVGVVVDVPHHSNDVRVESKTLGAVLMLILGGDVMMYV